MSRQTSKEEKKDESKINCKSFLALHPQPYLIEILLQSECGRELMTESEWLIKLNMILNRDITQ